MDEASFPNTSFDIVQTPGKTFVFAITYQGRKLIPSRVVRPQDIARVPQDGEVFAGSLGSLEEALNRSGSGLNSSPRFPVDG